MKTAIDALEITEHQLEKLTGFEIGTVFVGGVIRPSVWRSPQHWRSLLVTAGAILAVAFILCLGAGLVATRQWAHADHLGKIITAAGGITLLGVSVWYRYQHRQAQRLRSLLRLLDEVDRHNDMVQALRILDELATVSASSLVPEQRCPVLVALTATRDTLLSALMSERILRRHGRFIQQQGDHLEDIAIHLATLQALQVNAQASDYQHLLTTALEIGLAVQREL